MSTRKPFTTDDLAELDRLLNPDRDRCRHLYGSRVKEIPSPSSTPPTALIILFWILLEFWVHSNLACCINEKSKKDVEVDPTIDGAAQTPIELQPQANELEHRWSEDTLHHVGESSEQPQVSKSRWCSDLPVSGSLRALRLLVGIFLYHPVLAGFIIRMIEINSDSGVPAECARYVHDRQVHWMHITFLNIIPFIFATFAILRTVVDLILLWWGTGVHCDKEMTAKRKGFPWPPLFPLWMVVGLIIATWKGLKSALGGVDRWARRRKGRLNKDISLNLQEDEMGLLNGSQDDVVGSQELRKDGAGELCDQGEQSV